MSYRQRLFSVVALIASAGTGTAAHSAIEPQTPKPLELGEPTSAPAGFTEMCEREARFCGEARTTPSFQAAAPGVRPRPNSREASWHNGSTAALANVYGATRGESGAESANPEQALLRAINRAVNQSTAQVSDAALYSIDEFWTRSGAGRLAAGDCEDLAIEKRIRLIDAGFPADRLAFGVVYSRRSGLHTVLVARTRGGDVVLDNRTSKIRAWERTRYRWLGVQSMSEPSTWYMPR